MNFSRVRSKQLIALDKPAEFLDRLAQAGYHETMTGELSLKVRRIPHRLMGAALLRECRGSSPPMVMARLWALSQWVERAPVEAVLGGSCLEQLMSHGLVQQRGELVAASVDLCPVQGMWLASDRQWGGQGYQSDAVYAPGLDSLFMARWTPRWPCKRVLDLGTGSGIQALVTTSSDVQGFDINPRALEFARFNAHLNGCQQRATFRESDLYAAAQGQRYDLILSNPPWVPAPPGETEWFRGGGSSGEDLVERICRGLGDHLEADGRAALYVEYPEYQGQNYLDRVRRWLGPGQWGLALLPRMHYTTVEYVAGQTVDHFQPEADFERWCNSYEEQGIIGVSAGLMAVIRGATEEVLPWADLLPDPGAPQPAS